MISSIDKWRNGEKEMKEEKGTKLKMERKTLKVVAQSCQDISLPAWKGKKEKEREREFGVVTHEEKSVEKSFFLVPPPSSFSLQEL